MFMTMLDVNTFYTHYSDEHVKLFQWIPDGPIKADFWRVCVLHTFGGVYSDADNEPLVPLSDFVRDDVSMTTCMRLLEKI